MSGAAHSFLLASPFPTLNKRLTFANSPWYNVIWGIVKLFRLLSFRSSVPFPLDNYAELLKEKDERIREKDELIATLKERSAQDRKQKNRLLWFLALFFGIVAATLATVIIVDALNGGFGYFRY